MSNWKEEFKKRFWDSEESDLDGATCYYLTDDAAADPSLPIKFIEAEIIEELIEEIDKQESSIRGGTITQPISKEGERWNRALEQSANKLKALSRQLRAKWLGNKD